MATPRVFQVFVIACLAACAASRKPATQPVLRGASPTAAAPTNATAAPAPDALAEADASVERAVAASEAWRFDEMIADLEPALATYEAKLPATDKRVTDTMYLLARAYRGAARWSDALDVLFRRLDIDQSRDDLAAQVEVLNEMSLTYKEAGESTVALEYAKRCLEIDDELGRDEDDASRQTHLHNLALVYSDLGDSKRATKLLERVLASDRRLDPTSINTANTMHNLALEYRAAGDAKRARPLFESAVRILIAKRGPDHPHVIPPLAGLAGTLVELGEFGEAELVYRQLVDITTRTSSPDYRASALAILASLEVGHDATDDARAHIEAAIAYHKVRDAGESVTLVNDLITHTRVLLASNDVAGAEVDTDEAIAMSAALEETADHAAKIDRLANAWDAAGHTSAAKELRGRAAKLRRTAARMSRKRR